jgi:hypothetical protein
MDVAKKETKIARKEKTIYKIKIRQDGSHVQTPMQYCMPPISLSIAWNMYIEWSM